MPFAGSWSEMGLAGIPRAQTRSPVSDPSRLPGVRAAGPEVGVHAIVAELCRNGGGKIFNC